MQDGGQWLTVREFAQAAGVSIQAVYQRLDKDLTSYLKAENGRKYINVDALQFVGNSSTCQVNSSNIQAVDKRLNADDQRQQIDDLTAELSEVRDDLNDAQQRAAVAAAERDAERKRADTAEQHLKAMQDKHEQKESELTARIDDLTARLDAIMEKLHGAETAAAAARAGLDAEQKRTEDLKQQLAAKDAQISEALQRLAAEQALHAGTISQQKQIETAAEIPADDQPGDDQSDGSKKAGFFAKLFRKKKR